MYSEAKNEGTLLVAKPPQAPNSVEDGPRCCIQQNVASSTHQQWGLNGVATFSEHLTGRSSHPRETAIDAARNIVAAAPLTPAGVNFGSAPGWNIRFSHCVTR